MNIPKDWFYEDRVIFAPDSLAPGGECRVFFLLSADNAPGRETVWKVRAYEDNGTDEPIEEFIVKAPAPEKGQSLTNFPFPVKAGFAYIIERDDQSPEDTALGTEFVQYHQIEH
jgi:hypothetical protein